MGLVFSYLAGTEDINRRLVFVEKIVTTLEKNNTSLRERLWTLEDVMEKHRLLFQWDDATTLLDPTKVGDVQIDTGFGASYADEEAEKCKTQEEVDAYVTAHRMYTFRVEHNHRRYTRIFQSKDKFDAFKSRFAAWAGKRFSHMLDGIE